MKNTLIWGFDNQASPKIIQKLQKRGLIKPRFWIKQTRETHYFAKVEYAYYDDFFTILNFKSSVQAPKEIYRELEPYLFDFLTMNSRHQINFNPTEKVISRSIEDDTNLFYRFIDYFHEKLTKHEIELVLFCNLFHEGADFVIYLLAKALKIKTYLFYQSLFPNKFFYFQDVEQMGDIINSIPKLNKPANFSIPKNQNQKWFYMNKIEDASWHYDDLEKNYSFKNFFKKRKWGLIKTIFFGQDYFLKNEMQNKGREHRIIKLKKYIENCKKYFETNLDLSKPFVYFPLQLQPELTTATLGNGFVNQAKAVEALSEMLPDNVYIYIKENPKQWEAMRPPAFFNKLLGIKNVKLVDIKQNSLELIEKSLFVATITGTAGWESISTGKSVLSFGHAWYNLLPGVFRYSDNPSYNDIISYKINHQELEAQFNELTTRMLDGVIDRDYIATVPKFSNKKNNETVVNSLENLLTNWR